jgi:hypothetical protein
LALLLNAQEILAATGSESVRAAATTLLRDEDAAIVVVKDGPRGATLFDARGGEHWIPPYHSTRLYKIGSGDVFSATFARWWLQGTDAAEAADRASRQTAAYVESPVLPLCAVVESRPRRSVRPTQTVLLVAAASTLTGRWLIAVVEEALHHLGVSRIEKLDLEDWLTCAAPPLRAENTAVLICLADERTVRALPATGHRQVIFVDDASPTSPQSGSFSDLSQALYELCWDPE